MLYDSVQKIIRLASTDINQTAAMEHYCKLNLSVVVEESKVFPERLVFVVGVVLKMSHHYHSKFVLIFCSCENLLYFFSPLHCGSIVQ